MVRLPIEEIVKLNVPLSGTYRNMRIDSKRRFIIPKPLRRVYLLRQRKKAFKNCLVFVAPGKYPVIATMTDIPSPEECPDYNLAGLDKQGRVNVTNDVYLDIPENREVDLIGHGDYVEVRASNAREDQSSSTE